ncbi:MAG: hypothetical protein JWQ04_1855 [Pedosphaera sp.]|nr:hypothetical protein [Pedosphaera sp.]
MIIREIFRRAKQRLLPQQWLYLPNEGNWTLDTEGIFLDWENEEKDDAEVPLIAKEKNLRETLDQQTIENIVDWADRLAGNENDLARLEVFRYYFRFDAFPDKLGAPDPPPADEILRRLDLKFYDSLGPEQPGTKCRKEGCSRGAKKFSVFCKIHHFEQVKKRPCPFNH